MRWSLTSRGGGVTRSRNGPWDSDMHKFTPTQFAAKPGALYNAVQADGIARIVHKSRPTMVVMTVEHAGRLLNSYLLAGEMHDDGRALEMAENSP